MKVLIDVSHPALAHVFGHVIPAFHARGHETLVVARENKDLINRTVLMVLKK